MHENAEPRSAGLAWPTPAPRHAEARGLEAAPRAITEHRAGTGAAARRDRIYRKALASADVASAFLALLLGVAIFGKDHLTLASVVALPLVVVAAKIHGLYERDELVIRKTTMDEAPGLFQIATETALVFWLLDDTLVDGSLGNRQVLALWVLLFVFALAGRDLARRVAARVTPAERCLYAGSAAGYDRFRDKLGASSARAELVGRMSLQHVAERGARSSDDKELRELIKWTGADRVVIEPQALPDQEMLDFVRAAKAVGVRVSLLPRVLEVVGTSVVFDDLDGVTLLGVRRFGLSRSSWLVKRTFDLVGSVLCVVIAAPVMLVIAIAIKLDSPGPVLFRQTRVGRGGRHFDICKFRTMYTGAEQRKAELAELNECEDGLFKIADDPRVTRVGRLLRRTSLDELPQLFNVVVGNMSLVGPRPLVVDEDEKIVGLDRRRLQLTPGMTGHWQILGSSRVPLAEMVKIDYLYVAEWSLWNDVKLLLRTVPYMLSRRGM